MGADLRAVLFSVAAFAAVTLAPAGAPAAGERNACGCSQTESGACECDKKAKCGCPGECEPKGCEEKRQKEMDKEIRAETKRAQDAERSHGGEPSGERPEKSAERSAEKGAEKAGAARPLTSAQLHELARLLDLWVASHPGEAGKSVGDLARELGR